MQLCFRPILQYPKQVYLYCMKRTCIVLMAFFSSTAYSQNIEIGLSGGVSMNSDPSDNMVYKTDKSAINYAGSASVLYNLTAHIQYGLQANVMELSGTSENVYADVNHGFALIGGDDKRFVYAKNALLLCGVFNGKVNINRGYLYAGLALGYGISRQSSTTLSSGESYRAPDGGNGISFGGQLGYVVGVSYRFGFFAELAYRYIDLKYDAQAPAVHPSTDLHYHMAAYPFTIGVRYRILNTIMDNGYQQERGTPYSRRRR